MSIAENIDTVVATFQKGKTLPEQELGLDELIVKLNQTEKRYRSVAFEGASMGVAIANGISTWKKYANRTEKHTTQVHIGLGWAIAEQELDLASTLSGIEPEMQVKVLDGYGYWQGLFRRRLTIRTQSIPKNITAEFQAGFDQGVGRAIWYVAKGDLAKVVKIIDHFEENRKPNLWQGIGVASTYVGGCTYREVSELKAASKSYQINFETGVDAAEQSMAQALV